MSGRNAWHSLMATGNDSTFDEDDDQYQHENGGEPSSKRQKLLMMMPSSSSMGATSSMSNSNESISMEPPRLIPAIKKKRIRIASDIVREIFRFMAPANIPSLSLVNRRFSQLCEPLRHLLYPHYVEPLVITGRPVFPALEQMAGNLIQFRDRFSNSDHQSNQFPSTDPPRNIRGFEYISFTDCIGSELMRFLKVCSTFFYGCSLEFRNLGAFLSAHSPELVDELLALFQDAYVVHISTMYWRLLPALGRIVPEQCNRLNMCVTGNFDFTSLIPWLHYRSDVSRFLGINGRAACSTALLQFLQALISTFLSGGPVRFRFVVKLHVSAQMPEFSGSNPDGEQLRFDREYLEENYSYIVRRYNVNDREEEEDEEVFWAPEDESRCKIVIGSF